jgi:hypothetical protein
MVKQKIVLVGKSHGRQNYGDGRIRSNLNKMYLPAAAPRPLELSKDFEGQFNRLKVVTKDA